MTSIAAPIPLRDRLTRLTPPVSSASQQQSWEAPPRNTSSSPIPSRPDHLSHSQCRNYAGCSLGWWLSRRYAPEFVPSNLVFGSSFHAGLEAYYQAQLEGRVATANDLLAAFTTHWFDELAGKHGHAPAPLKFSAKDENEDHLRALALRMFEAFLAHHQQQPSEVIAIEEGFRIEVDTDLPPLAGKIDLIEIVTDEVGRRTLCLTDFKTAARKPSLDDLGVEQLQLYARAAVGLGLVNAFRLPLTLRYLVVTKCKEPSVVSVPVENTPRDWERLREKIRQTWRGMKAGVIFPSSSWRCAGCGHARLCGQWPALKAAA